ncbi:hypothetical protein L208DRAFT_1394441 [Tricholoma matsutake]|nr:hypothetical protein L208DRAFT_1394441 [Tricholoma matsutake 945]
MKTGTNDVSFVPILGAKACLLSQLSFFGMKCSHHMLGAAHVMRQGLVNLHFLERGRMALDSQTVRQTFQGTDFLGSGEGL